MVEQGKIDEGLAYLIDYVNGPGSWNATPEVRRSAARDNAWTIKGQAGDTLDPYHCADAGHIAVPVLLIAGEKSPLFFGKILDATQRCLKRSERVVIRNASHSMPRLNPAGFSEAVSFEARRQGPVRIRAACDSQTLNPGLRMEAHA